MGEITFAEKLDKLIDDSIADIISKVKQDNGVKLNIKYIASETMGQVIEKLLILNIRYWHLEDLAGHLKKGDAKYVEIKRKCEHCFAVEKPRLIETLNTMLKVAVAQGGADFLEDENIKIYKGYQYK